MKFRPKIEKIIKKNKKMTSPHNFVDFDDENHNRPKFGDEISKCAALKKRRLMFVAKSAIQ